MPAAAGQFYPAESEELKVKIKNYLASAPKGKSNKNVRAIIVPHAGYAYSGPVAAQAYQAIAGRKFKTIFLIGSSHASYFEGAAVDDHDIWRLPRGDIEVDKEAGEKLIALRKKIGFSGSAHEGDHMIEVQLPWLQAVLPAGFKILPIALGDMGDKNYLDLAEALSAAITDDDLLIISSDMSHYPAYEAAKKIDEKTLQMIKEGDVGKLEKYVKEIMSAGIPGEETLLCGLEAVKAGMALAQKLNWRPEILKYASSGDSAIGSRDSVVGYGAVAYKL